MAAEVSCSSLVRVLSGHMDEQPQIHGGNSDILITKDLLGNLSEATTTKEIVDLEFKTGKVQPQRCSSSSSPKSPLSASVSASSTSPDAKNSKLQDLNFPPLINFFEDMSNSQLDLKLQSSTPTTAPTPSHYQSVCTLDKVKYALERAEKEITTSKKRSLSPPNSLPATFSNSSSSSSAATTSSGMFAAACPGCLLYVMASNTNPRCPRCNSFVPSSMSVKKPRIDLNASF